MKILQKSLLKKLTANSFIDQLFFKMWVQIQMCLCFPTKYLHFILIQTFVRTKLQLSCTIMKIYIAYGVSHMLAPIASLGSLKSGPTTLGETRFRTKNGSFCHAQNFCWMWWNWTVTPRTIIFWKHNLRKSVKCETFILKSLLKSNEFHGFVEIEKSSVDNNWITLPRDSEMTSININPTSKIWNVINDK